MKIFSNFTKVVSLAMACALLMAFSSTVIDSIKVDTENDKSSTQVKEILFDDDCTSCRYVTVYDENDRLVYDKLVVDSENIEDVKLKKILDDSYFLMSNSITDYYIYSE